MVKTQKYENAFTEVYEILNLLEEEEYKKIPQEVMATIRANKNDAYEYEVNEELDLKEQTMSPEAKAILFNLFRDYLSTTEQKKKIVEMQKEERIKLKKDKLESKGINEIFSIKDKGFVEETACKEAEKTREAEKDTSTKLLIEVEKESVFHKILSKLKKIFKN